jgi:hypothetical protein
MSDSLVTVATFASPIEANLAKNYLEAAGIDVFLEGEEAAAMAWHLTNAFGDIKLQVANGDAQEALALLAEATDSQMLATGPSQAAPPAPIASPQMVQTSDPEIDEPEPELTGREADADRAFRGAVLGLLFFPLQLYVFWLLLKVYISDEQLHPARRRAAFAAALINLPVMAALCFLTRIMLSF